VAEMSAKNSEVQEFVLGFWRCSLCAVFAIVLLHIILRDPKKVCNRRTRKITHGGAS